MNRRYRFRLGWQAGYNQGYVEGFEAGYEAGFAQGKSFGYNEGHAGGLLLVEEVVGGLQRLLELFSRAEIDFCGPSADEARKLVRELDRLALQCSSLT